MALNFHGSVGFRVRAAFAYWHVVFYSMIQMVPVLIK